MADAFRPGSSRHERLLALSRPGVRRVRGELQGAGRARLGYVSPTHRSGTLRGVCPVPRGLHRGALGDQDRGRRARRRCFVRFPATPSDRGGRGAVMPRVEIDVGMRLLGWADRLACPVDMRPGGNESAETKRVNRDVSTRTADFTVSSYPRGGDSGFLGSRIFRA